MRAAGQRDPDPFAEGRRAAANVDRNVENLARQRAHQLPLGLAHLVVQAAQHLGYRERLVVLYEVHV
jgi:hypothetical protein